MSVGFKLLRLWKESVCGAIVLSTAALMFYSASPVFGMLNVDSLSYSSLLYLNGDFSRSSAGEVSDFKNNTDHLVVLGVNFRNMSPNDTAAQAIAQVQAAQEAEIQAEVIGKPLFYPNPARQIDNPKLWYVLSKNMDVEIRIYDMMANMILKSQFPAGSQGGKEGSNWLALSMNTFDQFSLSAGVYFVLVMHDGKVLGKGKVAIIP